MRDFDKAFFERMRDYLTVECDWFGMEEDNTVPQLKAAFEAAQNPPMPEPPTVFGARIVDSCADEWAMRRDGNWACLTSRVGLALSWTGLIEQYGPIEVVTP